MQTFTPKNFARRLALVGLVCLYLGGGYGEAQQQPVTAQVEYQPRGGREPSWRRSFECRGVAEVARSRYEKFRGAG